MKSFNECVNEYKKQLNKGAVQQAYRGLMDFIMALRTHLKKKHPDYFVSAIYQGYMDMSYFSFAPKSLMRRKLKIGIVFIHETMRFEVCLFGINKNIQTKYWTLIKESGWNKYHIVPTTKGFNYIIGYVLVENPDFSDLDALTKKIEKASLKFINDIETFLSKH